MSPSAAIRIVSFLSVILGSAVSVPAAQLKEAQVTQALSTSTQSLREALANPKARGQWGERMAEDVLRLAGFIEHVNYEKQTAVEGTRALTSRRKASRWAWRSASVHASRYRS